MVDARMNTRIATKLELSEEELVVRLTAGDERAFEALMHKYNRRLFRVARAIVREDADAEDAVQAGYVAAYLGLAHFAGRSSVGTWLTRIVMNEALARRRHNTRCASHRAIDEVAEELSDLRRSPEEALSLREVRHSLELAIDALPATYRVVLIMRQLDGLSGEETAHALGVSEEVVRVRLHRARAILRQRSTSSTSEVVLAKA